MCVCAPVCALAHMCVLMCVLPPGPGLLLPALCHGGGMSSVLFSVGHYGADCPCELRIVFCMLNSELPFKCDQ